MRFFLPSFVVVVGLIACGVFAVQGQSQVPGERFRSQVAGNPLGEARGNAGMLMQSFALPNGQNQIVLIDTNRKSIAVYHIAPDTGFVQLKSVRNIEADFMMEEFNGQDPTPQKIRGILGN